MKVSLIAFILKTSVRFVSRKLWILNRTNSVVELVLVVLISVLFICGGGGGGLMATVNGNTFLSRLISMQRPLTVASRKHVWITIAWLRPYLICIYHLRILLPSNIKPNNSFTLIKPAFLIFICLENVSVAFQAKIQEYLLCFLQKLRVYRSLV